LQQLDGSKRIVASDATSFGQMLVIKNKISQLLHALQETIEQCRLLDESAPLPEPSLKAVAELESLAETSLRLSNDLNVCTQRIGLTAKPVILEGKAYL
jgi:hypothetical protein